MASDSASVLNGLRSKAPGASAGLPRMASSDRTGPFSTLPTISSTSNATKQQHRALATSEVCSPANSTSDSQSPSPSDDGDDSNSTHPPRRSRSADAGSVQVGQETGDAQDDTRTGSTQHGAARGAAVRSGSNTADVKKSRACEACRGLKVRCEMEPNASPETPCRRCAKVGRHCIVTQPTRQRQKKTDSRVVELEKKIDALTASLQMTRHAMPGIGSLSSASTARRDEVNKRSRMSLNTSGSHGILRDWHQNIDPPQFPPIAQQNTSTTSNLGGSGGGRDTTIASAAAPPHSPYSASTLGRSPFSSGPPPIVIAGQKRKFSEIREATGVVSAGAGGSGPASRGGSASRAGSTASDESPSMRENHYHSYGLGHGHSGTHFSNHASQHAQSQKHSVPDSRHPSQTQSHTSPAYGLSRSPVGSVGSSTRFGTEYADIIDRGLLTMSKAVELFQRYVEQMAQHMPAVVFPPGTTAADVRKTKPVLFLSIMAASTTEMAEVQRAIVKELMQVLAERVFIQGEKSVELVQALQLAVIWYWPPEHFEELKFYQLVHTAAVMAIDLGLGKRRHGHGAGGGPGPGSSGRGGAPFGASNGSSGSSMRSPPATAGAYRSNPQPGIGGHPNGSLSNWRDHPFKKYQLPDPCSIEGRRTWLACYFMTANTAMALHRPNLVRWTSFMTECVEVLESSPDAAPTDKYLCHLVWTHRLAEEVGQQFSMDDPATVINIADPRTQYALRGFERELERYKSTIPRNLLQPCLRMSFEVLSLYMHEIALQTENGNDDFNAPYTAESTKEALIGDAALTPAHIRALTACLVAIDGIFDAFLGMDVQSLRCIPVFNFVRVAYATVVMIKMYLFASSPNSELGKVINKEHMKVEQHLNALLDKFRAAAAGGRSRPASKFMIVLAMIRSWFLKQQAHNPFAVQSKDGAATQTAKEKDAAANEPDAPRNLHQDAVAPSAAAGTSGSTYLPSSAFLSTVSDNSTSLNGPKKGNDNTFGTNGHLGASSTSSPNATPTLSVASGTTPNANQNNNSSSSNSSGQAQGLPPTQSTAQMQPLASMYSSANTPLQLLSEIAANDYAATAASAAGLSLNSRPGGGSLNSIPPWPPFYHSISNEGGSASTSQPSDFQQQQSQQSQQSQPPQQQQQQQQAPSLMPPPLSTADYMAHYPNLNLGGNFGHALDLTFVGLTEGADNMNLSDGLQYILADPWFGGGEAFQF